MRRPLRLTHEQLDFADRPWRRRRCLIGLGLAACAAEKFFDLIAEGIRLLAGRQALASVRRPRFCGGVRRLSRQFFFAALPLASNSCFITAKINTIAVMIAP